LTVAVVVAGHGNVGRDLHELIDTAVDRRKDATIYTRTVTTTAATTTTTTTTTTTSRSSRWTRKYRT